MKEESDATHGVAPEDHNIDVSGNTVSRHFKCPNCSHEMGKVVLHAGENAFKSCPYCGDLIKVQNTSAGSKDNPDLSETYEGD